MVHFRQYNVKTLYKIYKPFNPFQRRYESQISNIKREVMEYDVVLVGGGPASLAAAIKLKQLCQQHEKEISVAVIEKGKEIGSHILSGNIFEPRALDELLPNWKNEGAPIVTPVIQNKFSILTEKMSISLPDILFPSQMKNKGNYVISLGQLAKWLAAQAEGLGVEIYPGFSASDILLNKEQNRVIGVVTSDMGVNKDGTPKENFEPGVELHAKYTLFGEGCRGSCSEKVINMFNLRKNSQNQTYGLGLKEIWQLPKDRVKCGYVEHCIGWPLQTSIMSKTYGGSFIYHMNPNQIHIGLIIGLDYSNPYINPYEEFQKFKTHPNIKKHLHGGECISYGARCLNEGGYHSIPQLYFPGGALIGDSAGFLNVVKIKGTHTAMKSGMLAAEAVFEKLNHHDTQGSSNMENYEKLIKKSWINEELYEVRNSHASFHYGITAGLAHSALSAYITKGKEPWTLNHGGTDSSKTSPASGQQSIRYPSHDNDLTFDLLTNLQRSGTSHKKQPSHLHIKPQLQYMADRESYEIFHGMESRFCPAQVYEFSGKQNSEKKLVINSENCLHCKACSIKAPKEYIDWTAPEGGDGPLYEGM